MKASIVGICGRLGSGKTTAAMHLVESHNFTRHRFAGPLKAAIKALGLSDDEIDGHLKEAPCELLCGRTPRYAMQTLGTEWGRDLIGPDFWVRSWHATLPAGNVVCDDVRFANEASIIREMGGFIIRVDRPGLPETDHVSERVDIEPDAIVVNDRGIRDLEAAISGEIASA